MCINLSTPSLIVAQICSAGFKSGEFPGQALFPQKLILLSWRSFCVANARMHGALSCKKIASLTEITFFSLFRNGIVKVFEGFAIT